MLCAALLASACSAPPRPVAPPPVLRAPPPILEPPEVAVADDERVLGTFRDGSRPLRSRVPAGWEALETADGAGLAAYRLASRVVCTVRSSDASPRVCLDRLCRRVGQPRLAADERETVPRVPILGGEGLRLRVVGRLRGDDAAGRTTLIGVVVPLAEEVLVVELVGPSGGVGAHEDAFDAYCASLR